MIFSNTQIATLYAKVSETKSAQTITKTWVKSYVLENIAPLTKRGIDENFWRAINEIFAANYFAYVEINKGAARVKCAERNKLYALHIANLLKENKQIFWLQYDNCYEITKRNISALYKYLEGAPVAQYEYMERNVREETRIAHDKKREKEFHDIARPNIYRKIGKRGFNTSFNELRAFERHNAYEKELRGITKKAKEILGVL